MRIIHQHGAAQGRENSGGSGAYGPSVGGLRQVESGGEALVTADPASRPASAQNLCFPEHCVDDIKDGMLESTKTNSDNLARFLSASVQGQRWETST